MFKKEAPPEKKTQSEVVRILPLGDFKFSETNEEQRFDLFKRLLDNKDFQLFQSFIVENIAAVDVIAFSGKKDGELLSEREINFYRGQRAALSFIANFPHEYVSTKKDVEESASRMEPDEEEI